MIKLKWLTPHLMLGMIIGLFAAALIIIEGSYLIWANEARQLNISPIVLERIFKIIAVITFIIIVSIFNSKRFKKINLNRISIYILFSIVISGISAYIVMVFIASTFLNKYYFEGNINIFTVNIISFGLIGGSIGGFIITFLLLINRRVKYIKFLTREVKMIKEDGFGRTIEVKGKDELAELCESINSMSVELKEKIDNERKLEQNKNELITNVSHDLRTPLTSIMGYVDLIKNEQYKNEDDFKEYIGIIDDKAKTLNKLINELFEYTKLTSTDIQLNYSEVDIVSLVDQIAGEYEYVFEKEDLKLKKEILGEEIILRIDIEKIVRVLDNLLTNAKKYSTRGTEVFLKLAEEADNLMISISNKTNEIKEEDLGNIFERFYKGDKSRKDIESSGIGLSIVKRIIELHNGVIYVDMNKDIITFTINLPLK